MEQRRHDEWVVNGLITNSNVGITYTTTTSNVSCVTCAGTGDSHNEWTHWTTGTSTSVTTELNLLATWYTWNEGTVTVNSMPLVQAVMQNTPVVMTPDQARLNDQVVAAYARTQRKDQAVKRLARIKAERILTDHLSNEQRQDLSRFGFFKLYVNSKDGPKVYRIRRGQVQNIDLMREKADGTLEPIQTLCAHPEMMVPDADAMLIQKLMLESAEDQFLQIANKMAPVMGAFHPPVPRQRVPRIDPVTEALINEQQRVRHHRPSRASVQPFLEDNAYALAG